MIKLAYFVNRIRDVKLKDYLSVFPMTVALIAKSFFKKKYEKAWLICEEAAEARDNGYHFFRYMCQKQPQQKCFYAIKKKSVDYNKVQKHNKALPIKSPVRKARAIHRARYANFNNQFKKETIEGVWTFHKILEEKERELEEQYKKMEANQK